MRERVAERRLCTSIPSALPRGERGQRGDAGVGVAGGALGVGPADLGGHVPGRGRRARRPAPRSPARTAPASSRISAATSWASIRSGRICAARRAWTSADPLRLSSVLSASARVRKASAAPSRGAGDLVERHLLAGGEPVAQVEQRRVGHAAGQRLVDQRDRVGLAADLGEDLGMGDDRRAVEVQRARPRRRRGSPRPRRSRRRRPAPAPCGTGRRRRARRCRSSRRSLAWAAAKSSRPTSIQPASEPAEQRVERCSAASEDAPPPAAKSPAASASPSRTSAATWLPGSAVSSRSASGRAVGDVAHRDAATDGVGEEADVRRVERSAPGRSSPPPRHSRRGSPPASRRDRRPTGWTPPAGSAEAARTAASAARRARVARILGT